MIINNYRLLAGMHINGYAHIINNNKIFKMRQQHVDVQLRREAVLFIYHAQLK